MGSNPALQYISAIESDSADSEHITDNKQETDNKQRTDNDDITHNTHYADNTYNTSAMSNTHNTYNAQEKHNNHNAHIAHSRETKSRRLNLLLQPSLLDNMTKIARMKQTSVNDLINTVLRSYIEQEATVVERYEEVFGQERLGGRGK
jgi:predicted HicB family RNase H-like nuclease